MVRMKGSIMSNALTLPSISSLDSLDQYLRTIKTFPVLSAEEEHELATRYRAGNDLEAAKSLIMSHLRLVASIARGYSGYGLPQADLIQEGNIGLMKAVKRFDPAFGVRLVSFAVHWIRAEMHEYILRNWRIVKVATTKAQRKLFFNLRSAKQRLGWMNSEEVESVAKDLGVSAGDVLEMEKRLAAHDASFDGSAADEDDDIVAPALYIEDQRDGPEQQFETEQNETGDQEKLRFALESLDDRSREIIHRRWLDADKTTLHELADKFNVSAERIRQLEQNAMKNLRRAMTAA